MPVTIEELDRLYRALPPRPTDTARVDALNVRPGPDQREERTMIELDPVRGAIGDRWERKTWLYLQDGRPDPRVQVALCNSTILTLIQTATGVRHHPGDTIFTDLDLSAQNLPVGSRLQIGPAVLEISDVENDACAKFAAHYGAEVLHWIRLPQNRPLRLRGLFAKIVCGGPIRVGDTVTKLTP
ncbi:MAG: hypothetical protein IPP19_10670 [Verrucomicrobia bacterium]|nr:hypothetical protein [Verrucomicrobiota bacterium]